tara:strand:+ start:229 stop:765 length:537 start_codon:yes stop_codon:yes gene_type:complete
MEQQLIDYITQRNADTQEWVDAKEGRAAGFIPTDPAFFESNGWTTLKSYQRGMLEATAYDMCGEAYSKSFARSMNFKMMTNAQLDAEIESYSASIEVDMKQEAVYEQECVVTFQSIIDKTIANGARDEETALRWLVDGTKFYSGQCVESFVWEHGILFTQYGKELVSKIKNIVTYEVD